MLKGITKRIIEINNTESEYFEKVILFVRPEKATYPAKFLNDQAKQYVADLSGQKKISKKKSPLALIYFLTGVIIVGCIILAVQKYAF